MEDREYRSMFRLESSHWWFAARRVFVQAVLAALPTATGRRIADIGAGTGGMTALLSRYGQVTAVEPSEVARSFARKHHIRMKAGRAESTGLSAARWDLVCLFDVLYHEGIDDRRALSHAHTLLRPGGHIVITDCAVPALYGPHDRAVRARERYTRESLVRKVREAGFQVSKQSYTFFLVFPFFAAKRLWDRFFSAAYPRSDVDPVHPILNRLLLAVCRWEGMLLPHVSYPWGSSLVVVARKGVARKQ